MNKKIAKILLFISLLLASCIAFAKTDAAIQVSGLQGAALKNVQKRLALGFLAINNPTATSIRAWYEQGPENIKKALEPFGYFHASTRLLGLNFNQRWIATFAVNPGPPLYITTLHVNVIGPGADNHQILHALHKIPLRQGDVFNVTNYDTARDNILYAAQTAGYLNAKPSINKITIDLVHYTCTIDLTIDTMERYYFGITTFSENPLSPKFLKRFINYKEGAPFSAKKITHFQNNLAGAGYFKEVDATPHIDKAVNYHIPIDVNLVPEKRKSYQLGIGYGNVSGARITAGINWRWVNRWGHKFNTNLTWSNVQRNLQAEYVIPAHDPAHNQYVINAGYFTLHPRHGKSTVKKIGFGYLTTHGKWQRNINLSYMIERYQVDPDEFYRTAHVLLPNISFNWVSTSNPINIKNGARVYFILQGGAKPLASSVNFLQGEARAKLLKTFYDSNRVILRGDAGYTIIQDADKLPLSLRFYAGGPGSVRGYAIDSSGPGRYLTVGSAEYQRKLHGNWYGAVFYDAGEAFNTSTTFKQNLAYSTGVGVVWESIIGNVSVYISKALATKGKPLRFDFSVGPDI